MLALIPEEAIDDIVSSWSLITKDHKSDLGGVVSTERLGKLSVELLQKWVMRLVLTLLGQDSILNLDKVGTELVGIQVFELFSDLGLNKLTVWRIFLARDHSEIGLGQAVWHSDFGSDSSSREHTEGRLLSEEDIVGLVSLLILLLDLSGINEGVDIWVSDHVVEEVTAWSSKLNGSWRLVAVEIGPLSPDSLEALEHGAVKLDERLGDDRLVLTSSSLEAHHGWQWAARSDPFGGVRVSETLDARHVT